jgi:hypothetical protein
MTRTQTAVVGGLTAALLTVTGVAGAVGLRGHTKLVHTTTSAVRAEDASAHTTPVAAKPKPLPRLRRLTPPDAMVTLDGPATPRQLRALHRLWGVRAVVTADTGYVRIAGRQLRVLGADPVALRAFTPRFTATSRPLWESVARGELSVDYSLAGRMPGVLGATLPAARGRAVEDLRVGAFASLGLGRAEGVVDLQQSRALGLATRRVVIVSAPKVSDSTLRADLTSVFGAHAHVRLLRPPKVNQFVISAYAKAMIPSAYLRLYRAAAMTCRGLPWTVLAAIGTVETGNGANTATSSKGAMGPMQFLPSTFVAYAVDGDGDGVANIMDPADAIYSAARYLCANGAGLGGQALYSAIYAYNHADWYVREVIRLAIAYT